MSLHPAPPAPTGEPLHRRLARARGYEQAAKKAASYLEMMPFSRGGLKDLPSPGAQKAPPPRRVRGPHRVCHRKG
jgi:hypothetical protein